MNVSFLSVVLLLFLFTNQSCNCNNFVSSKQFQELQKEDTFDSNYVKDPYHKPDPYPKPKPDPYPKSKPDPYPKPEPDPGNLYSTKCRDVLYLLISLIACPVYKPTEKPNVEEPKCLRTEKPTKGYTYDKTPKPVMSYDDNPKK